MIIIIEAPDKKSIDKCGFQTIFRLEMVKIRLFTIETKLAIPTPKEKTKGIIVFTVKDGIEYKTIRMIGGKSCLTA